MNEKLKIHDGDTPGKTFELKLEYPKPKVATMSKDIWHEPTETPTEHKTLLFDSIEFDETEMGVYSGGLFHSYNEFEPMTPAGLSRWAYLSDFINCQKELIRTRKALDVALCSLQDIAESNGDFITGASTPLDEHEYADMMFKEIKRQMKIKTALEQKD